MVARTDTKSKVDISNLDDITEKANELIRLLEQAKQLIYEISGAKLQPHLSQD